MQNPAAVVEHTISCGGATAPLGGASGDLRPASCGHAVLRPKLRFGMLASAAIMMADTVLRFSWLLRFHQGWFPSKDHFVLVSQLLEVFRYVHCRCSCFLHVPMGSRLYGLSIHVSLILHLVSHIILSWFTTHHMHTVGVFGTCSVSSGRTLSRIDQNQVPERKKWCRSFGHDGTVRWIHGWVGGWVGGYVNGCRRHVAVALNVEVIRIVFVDRKPNTLALLLSFLLSS